MASEPAGPNRPKGRQAGRPAREGDKVTAGQIEAAYAPFVASLRYGGHLAPQVGWSAELIAAHVAANNDRIAEAAERIVAGETPDYDNAAAVDEKVLVGLVEKAGGLLGLADEVERSAARLAAARARLTDEQSGTEIHVVIHSDGEIVADRPIAIGAFIAGNAGFHLDSHREQLRALEPPLLTEPPASFDSYEIVLLLDNPDAPERDEDASAVLLRQHLGHFTRMYRAGYMKVAGPLRGWSAALPVAGISLYQTGSVEKTRKLAEDDPAVRAGDMTVEVLTWYTAKNAISFAEQGSEQRR